MSLGALVGSILLIAGSLAAVMAGVAFLARRRQRPVPGSMETAAVSTLVLASARLALAGGYAGAVPPAVLSWSAVVAYLSASWFVLTVIDFLYIGEYLIEARAGTCRTWSGLSSCTSDWPSRRSSCCVSP